MTFAMQETKARVDLQPFPCACQAGARTPCTAPWGALEGNCCPAAAARQAAGNATDANLTLTLRVGALVSFRAVSPNLTYLSESPASLTQWPAAQRVQAPLGGRQAGVGLGPKGDSRQAAPQAGMPQSVQPEYYVREGQTTTQR